MAIAAFGIQSAGLCRRGGGGGAAGEDAGATALCPPSGDACAAVVALRAPGATSGAELELGTLSFFPSFMYPLTVKRAQNSNSSTQIRVRGFFSFQRAPFWGWFCRFGAGFAILELV